MQSAHASSVITDARSLAAAMARDALDQPPAGWAFDFNGGIETEVDVGDLVLRVTVGDESCEDDSMRMMYLTASRYDGDELVDGLTADLSEDGLRILDVTSWFADDEGAFLRNIVETSFSARTLTRRVRAS